MKFRDRLRGSNRNMFQHKEKAYDTRGCRFLTPFFALLLTLSILLWGAESRASGIDDSFYLTNGTVRAIVDAGSTVYIGGDFTAVGRPTGSGVGLDTTSGDMDTEFPQVVGTVSVVISDGQEPNGWYIAGDFTRVGEFNILHLAHILPDKTLDTIFAPVSSLLDGSINAMVLDGGMLYVGGDFTLFSGSDLPGVVAIDTEALAINTIWRPAPDKGDDTASVDALAVSGTLLYIAGDFTTIGGESRSGLAAVEVAGGEDILGAADAAWDPNPGSGTVHAMMISGSTLYAGGTFSSIGGQTRSRLAATQLADGANTGLANATWNPGVTGTSVAGLLVSGNRLYVSGRFTAIGGQVRNNIAVIDTVGTGDGTGRANATWNPNITATSVSALALDGTGNRLYVGGDFSSVGGLVRHHIAVVDAAGSGDGSGNPDASWDPDANQPVASLVLSSEGSRLYMGGRFNSIGVLARNRIAAIDKTTGIATDWNPGANGTVNCLTLSGNTLYAGGLFTTIGGQARNRVAALDVTTNAATTWDPNANAGVNSILAEGTTLYVGGDFTTIGGSARGRIAALNTATSTATPWDPDADDSVNALLLSGSTLYVGGSFTEVGGSPRSNIAALDTAVDTGAASAWDPQADAVSGISTVNALALFDTTLYVGGTFDTIGGESRNNIAALDTALDTDSATSWDPDIDDTVHTMALNGTTLYVGGIFGWTGGDGIHDEDDPNGIDAGIQHSAIAALDIARTVRIVRTWNPGLFGETISAAVHAIATDGSSLLVGGNFDRVEDAVGGHLARFNFTPPTLVPELTGGTYPKEQFIRMTCETGEGFECDTAYYTLDGSDPTAFSSVMAFGGVYIDATATLKFFAIDNAGAVGPIQTETYTITHESALCFIGAARGQRTVDRIVTILGDIIRRW
ncbi:MAG: chitobiase/beta-hexosaminidase C-terminal domain-containing protein [Desulfobacterales bacterium]